MSEKVKNDLTSIAVKAATKQILIELQHDLNLKNMDKLLTKLAIEYNEQRK